MSEKIDYIDRYDALGGIGGPWPKASKASCRTCEGMHVVPVFKDNMDEPFRTLWLEAENKNPTDDGWHFVMCPDCWCLPCGGKGRLTQGGRG